MAESKSKGRHYLFVVFGKAWEEVSFIEVLSEALGGFVLAIIALYNHWIDQGDATDIALECAGCALLIPFIAFVLRAFFAAPAELVKETAEAKKKIEINPKSVYPAIISLLLAICSFLAFGLFLSLKFNFHHYHGNLMEASIKEPPKPLPEKIIARPEPLSPPLIVPTQQLVAVENPTQLESFYVSNGGEGEDFHSQIARLKAENQAKAESEHNKRNLEQKKVWDIYLPLYKRALVVLHDTLTSDAAKTKDGIAQSEGYFQCLPPIIDSDTGEIKVAEIRFQKNTNMDFFIKITGPNQEYHRTLIISSGVCWMGVEAEWGDAIHRTLHIDPDFDNTKRVTIDKANDFIPQAINDLIAARVYSLSNTNR